MRVCLVSEPDSSYGHSKPHQGANLLLHVSLPGLQQALQGLSLGSQPIGLLPECSLSGAQQLEDVLALSRAQELAVLRDKGLDVERHVLQLQTHVLLQIALHFLESKWISYA